MYRPPKGPAVWAKVLIALAFLFSSGLIWAQEDNADQDEDQVEETAAEEEGDVAELGNVVVTGSRLQRPTYSSIAPLQIITAEGSREAGLINAADILQDAPAATGQQIDLTFQGFVLDNGPGASTLSLRGLGSNRTLVLLNGRRLSPAGVEGAPIAPDLNLVPSALVQQYDLLLDGASSIYGSDAVAGVANIILRNDFDGLELDVFTEHPEFGAGSRTNLSAVWGRNFDRGFIGMGLNYEKQESIKLSDTDWTKGCEQHREIDENGNIRTQDLFYQTTLGMQWDECRLGSLVGRVSVPRAGSIYFTPGFSNGGWNDFSESSNPIGGGIFFGVDGDGDGQTDLTFRDYDLNGTPASQRADLFPEQERINFMSYGEYVFEGDWNNTFFFEFGYNERDTIANSGAGQFFPDVPADNLFNICNPNGINGVDCGLAFNELLSNPNYQAQFAASYFEPFCAPAGLTLEQCTPAAFGLFGPALGPQGVTPIVSVAGDRNIVETNIKQYRAVAGLRGDLPFMDIGSLSGWQYDAYVSYTESRGESSRSGLREDRLLISLETTRIDDNGNIVCGNGSDGCVPINMFAPSLYTAGNGNFATQAERDYLFDSRDFDTRYKQTIVSAFASGFIASLPGGEATGGLGFEWRLDDINSIPDEVARDGLFFGFFRDGGAEGDKYIRELFGEVELPIAAGMPGVEELVVNLSGRLTDDEFYGSDFTYSGKLGWRPVPSLLIRGTYGTSYRAPNLRELFLVEQTGFLNVLDPCIIPEDARGINGEYIPEGDDREPEVLQNCINQGVDPTALDNNGFNVLSTEIARVGVEELGREALDPETSTSFTYGFSFEQPWFDAFNLTFGATYYDIKIEDTIIEPTPGFLVNDCYTDVELDSVFCDRVVRGEDGFIEIVNAGFLNQAENTIRGVDINLNYDQDFTIADRPFNFAVDVVANHSVEARQVFINDDGDVDRDDDDSEFGFPNWQGTADFRLRTGDWRFTWRTRFIGNVRQDPDGVDEFDDIGNTADTCLGPPSDVLCRDFAEANEYFLHTTSLYYDADNWSVGIGVRNVFDESPPLVDGTEVLSVNNVPIGVGYDLRGRQYFLDFSWNL